MPITFHPAAHRAEEIHLRRTALTVNSPDKLLRECSPQEHVKCERLIRSSFSDLAETSIQAVDNGFVRAAVQAYNEHHNLIIRPDDVWLAILAQFSIYVNAHPEQMREYFVSHKGKEELEVIAYGNTETYDWSEFPLEISKMIEKKVTDPELRNWIIPTFSTTTETDKVICSIMMMSTLQSYFSYKCTLACGIPSVTLLGEKSDWENISTRIKKLTTFGDEVSEWHNLLHPVITRFVTAFDHPDSSENNAFWQKIADKSGGGSGPPYLSGWITAFCFWDERGENLHRQARKSERFLFLDGALFHHVDMEYIPPGWAAVPVNVDDNGYVYSARMGAGSVGVRFTNSEGGEKTVLNTLQAEAGWWMFKVKPEMETREEREAVEVSRQKVRERISRRRDRIPS
ncbi:hypothetical protein MMC28_011423 [Mycoblastus sanguinarius]|nr:hypothetical protein [Mycoblastus sanguinarius]